MLQPLAERLRPTSFDTYIGQEHLVGTNGVLRRMIATGYLPSIILWGPPGVGKTTLANLMAKALERPFLTLSAVHSGVKEVREAIEKARSKRFFTTPVPILFIDEIHRFSKSQQDSLLGAVEEGVITLIGATTENPSFEVIPALLSRCQTYVLKPLEAPELTRLAQDAVIRDVYLNQQHIVIEEFDALLRYAGGDARKLYNILEIAVSNAPSNDPIRITDALIAEVVQTKMALYDKGGEQHYDIASAFIKSIRGSDPNAAVYWLARMIEGGEDVKFIARRMVIAASEDIGLANPNALLMANTAMQAAQAVGLPEARIILSQAVIYLATSPKSNSAYLAIDKAQQLVRQTGSLPVPLHLRNAPTSLMKNLNYGKNYQYAHDYPGNFIEQDFLPESLENTILFEPQHNPAEEKIRQRLQQQWKRYDYK